VKFVRTQLPEVVIVQPQVFGDQRGFFLETWHARKFADAGIDAAFVQDNRSRSSKGTLRGLHLQLEHSQGKLVQAISGEIFDIAVDVRKNSPNFGKWVSCILSEENKHALWIPPGFAHGFYVMSDTADVLYKCTDFYMPQYERTVRWDDPDLNIPWPLDGATPILSAKDSNGLTLQELKALL
jgi:dTDP-4-dehydrorhamnose 3,5-epimerase